MNFYENLGIKTKINAATTYTVLGGSLMPDEVILAMNQASKSFVDMHELQSKAGEKLAKLTKNDSAYFTSGCAAAIVLSILAFRTKGDLVKIGKLIENALEPAEVIVQTGHRIPYDPAITLAGAKIVTVGDAIQTFPWQIEAAINSNTVGIFFTAGAHLAQAALDLEKVVEIAHAHDLPVVVDAAAQLPPVENLWKFTKSLGADLVLFSGGKALRGPQSSGMILGDAFWIEAIRANGAPNQRMARAMKVGKEEIAGLLTAVERYVSLDHDAESARHKKIVNYWAENLKSSKNYSLEIENLNEAGQPVPRIRISFTEDRAIEAVEKLKNSNPSIEVVHNSKNSIWLSPDCIENEEEIIVAESFNKIQW